MDDFLYSEANLLFTYVKTVSKGMTYGEDEEAHLRELLAARSSLQDQGIADAELQRIGNAYEQNRYYRFCWQDLQPLYALYRIYSDETCIQNLWRQVLWRASYFKSMIDEEGQLQLIEAIQDFHRLHQADSEWQDQYYEMIKDMTSVQRHERALMRLLEIWSTLPEDQETYAEARKELLGQFWNISFDNSENSAGIAALDSILQPWLQDEGMMERFEAECLEALVAISEHQAAPELERNLLFINAYADAYPRLYSELLSYTISARYALSRDMEAALADVQELKDLAAAARWEAEGDDWAQIASLVMACFYRMLTVLTDSETDALGSLLQAAEMYMAEIGCMENFELEAGDEVYSVRMRTVYDRDPVYYDVPAHYCYILFELQARDIPALQPFVIWRLKFMQQQQNSIFMACLSNYLDDLSYSQQIRLAREVFADFLDQEHLMHAIACRMADKQFFGILSRQEVEECLQFMRECLQRFPKQHSFLLVFCNAVQCLAQYQLQFGETLDELLLLETREWMDVKLVSADFELYKRLGMLEQYVRLFTAIAMMQHGEEALRTLHDVDDYHRGHREALTNAFGVEPNLNGMWDSIRRDHPDAEVREAVKKLQEQGEPDSGR